MGLHLSNVLALIGVVTLLIVLKVMLCACLRRRQNQTRPEDTLPILEETIERLQEIHQTRLRARRAREPPPTFEDALRNSRPVSYIDVEEMPPTYDEYLKSNSNSFTDNFVDNSPSVNPSCDYVIPLDVCESGGERIRFESNA